MLPFMNGDLHGYELKSDHDVFRRPAGQGGVYNSVLRRVTLAVTSHDFRCCIELVVGTGRPRLCIQDHGFPKWIADARKTLA